MDANEKFERMAQIARAFSRSAAIGRKGFAGRSAQITDVINACMQRGQHVVIFGERGAGKTSLANILIHILDGKFTTPPCGSINCDHTTIFSSLWRAIFAEIPISRNLPLGFKSGSGPDHDTLAQYLPEIVTPDVVRAIPQKREKLLSLLTNSTVSRVNPPPRSSPIRSNIFPITRST